MNQSKSEGTCRERGAFCCQVKDLCRQKTSQEYRDGNLLLAMHLRENEAFIAANFMEYATTAHWKLLVEGV